MNNCAITCENNPYKNGEGLSLIKSEEIEVLDMENGNKIHQFGLEYTQQLSATLQNILEEAKNESLYPDMFSSVIELSLYQHLIKSGGYKTVLELGMFLGLSTLAFAEVLPNDGKVVTIEANRRYCEIAQRSFAKSNHGYKIEIRENWANFELVNLNETFDFIFIDADKDNYGVYYDILLPKLNPKGTLVIDNMFWHGNSRKQSDKKGRVIHQLNEQIKADHRVVATFLPIGDGVMLIRYA